MTDSLAEYLGATLHTRDEVLSRPCPIPAARGVYGWWFDALPSGAIDTSNCEKRDGLTLLYAGISPSRPPANGTAPSKQTIRTRIKNHYRGNAAGSTLRLTLGCLLATELGIELQRTASGKKRHFHQGESILSDWMSEHAFVSWVENAEPWILEDNLIENLDLPLNLAGNREHPFFATLSRARADLARRAEQAPTSGKLR
ncbi:hypothetical protein QSJ18_18985 [Gordonia sp. ABSL1-1]|uniref:GIY-YIG nuclease family protein n=1 Tax=Gordonia sp. ABSL1-1 TaxID=3053923 RepID=UPI0025725E88|nr:hypothetical protein [Gordonia sp. ABSL1-1]MDL9938836.1 hypothetical protein [Gordonia sp. ABSL1-1]